MVHGHTIDIAGENRRIDDIGPAVAKTALGIGVVTLVVAVVMTIAFSNWTQFLKSYLVSFAYFLSLALGALFFVLIQHVTRAGWSVLVRRIAEVVASTMPVLLLLALPILAGVSKLYPWAMADAPHEVTELVHKKAPYLTPWFFYLRVAIYFVVWIWLANYFLKRSLKQDETGDPELTSRMQWMSAPGLFLFAFSVTFAALDFLKSLNPMWFSTIFGVYYFAGAAVGFFSLLAIAMYWLQSNGRLVRVLTPEHYHDVGKLMFAFVVFWTYIAFSQFMLIWYANLPEETHWYLVRQTGDWTRISIGLLIGHFVIPFLCLISRWPKRSGGLLVVGAVWILLLHWIDMYYLVMPPMFPKDVVGSPWHILDALCFVGVGGVFVGAVVSRLARHSLIPERDPRLVESLAFENY